MALLASFIHRNLRKTSLLETSPALEDLAQRSYFGSDADSFSRTSGIMAGTEIRGLQSKGVIPMMKYFAANEQETHRSIGGDLDIAVAAVIVIWGILAFMHTAKKKKEESGNAGCTILPRDKVQEGFVDLYYWFQQ